MKNKKNIVKLMGIVLLTSLTSYAQDDQVSIDAGLGILGSKGYSLSQDKFIKFGLQEDFWGSLKQRFNTGVWLDSRGTGKTSSAFAGYQLGVEVTNDVLQASVFMGPNVITSPDEVLGGPIQFNESVFLGIVDKTGTSIGVCYNHFSSAGLYNPNIGRDFLTLQLKFPF